MRCSLWFNSYIIAVELTGLKKDCSVLSCTHGTLAVHQSKKNSCHISQIFPAVEVNTRHLVHPSNHDWSAVISGLEMSILSIITELDAWGVPNSPEIWTLIIIAHKETVSVSPQGWPSHKTAECAYISYNDRLLTICCYLIQSLGVTGTSEEFKASGKWRLEVEMEGKCGNCIVFCGLGSKAIMTSQSHCSWHWRIVWNN